MTVGCIHVLMFRRHGFSLRGRVLLSVDNHVGPVWWVGEVFTMYHVSVVSVRLDSTFEYIRGACSIYSCLCHGVFCCSVSETHECKHRLELVCVPHKYEFNVVDDST